MPNGPLQGLKNAQGKPLLSGATTIQAAPPGDIDPSEIMRGEIPLPGEGLLTGAEAATASARDLLKGGNVMDRMYEEANPIFKKLQATGMFSNRPQVQAVQGLQESAPVDEGFVNWLQEQRKRIPSLDELSKQLPAWGKPTAPYQNVTRMPVQGGVLHDVLSRAAEKAGSGGVPSPGEARLLEHFSKLVR
jgi:hypothetical protein